MRFPNIFQTIILIFSIVLISWLLNDYTYFIKDGNLKSLIVSIIRLIVLLVVLFFLSKRGYIDKQGVKFKIPNSFLSLISALVGVLIMFNPILSSISFFKEEDISEIGDSIISQSIDIFVFLNLVIVTPIFEELFFRSLILNGLKNNYNIILALILSSVLFGIFHVGIVTSILFGIWMGWIFIKTNNISLCIIAHAVCNLGAFLFRIIAKNDQEQKVSKYIGDNTAILSIIMFVLTIFLIYIDSKKIKTIYPQV